MSVARPAQPANFDRPIRHRGAMIAKIHVARKQLNIDEDDYRQILLDQTGHLSLRDCNSSDLANVIERLKKLGFRPLPAKGRKPTAQHPMARKARALWISLYQLGAVRNPSEEALEAFAKRQLGCEKLVWARQSDAYRLIEALKAMAHRNGWSQADENGKALSPMKLREQLCEAILVKLQEGGHVPADWSIDVAAFRLCGFNTSRAERFSIETYAELAGMLGKKLRELNGEDGA